MAADPLTGVTLLAEGTMQADVLVNELNGRLQACLARVKSWGDTSPPGSPATFDAYIVGTSATGDWSGYDGKIAVYLDGWKFITPAEGMRMRVLDENITIEFDGSNWGCVRGFQVLTDGANIAWDTSKGKSARVVLGGNRTMDAPTKIIDGERYTLMVVQDGVGSRTLTWNAAFKWPGGSAPTLTTDVDGIDVFQFLGYVGELYAISSELALA